MKILAIGDVTGPGGVDFLCARLGIIKSETGADLVVVNGENACGVGISPAFAEQLYSAGTDVITLGNHAYNNRRIYNFLDDNTYIIRPANMPPQRPGMGYTIVPCLGKRVCVANLIGCVYMDYNNSSPFLAATQIIESTEADIYVFDFHAEATSEKQAMAFHLDGRAQVLFGTHTHVQTADERVLSGGLGYITDLGMTGGLNSVLGVKPEAPLARFLGALDTQFEPSESDMAIQGALFELDGARCTGVTRICRRQG